MDFPDSEAQPNKRIKKKSTVWEHFTVMNAGPGCARAYCKSCSKSFAYMKDSKQSGTSHLKRHILLCQKNQQTPHSKTDADSLNKRKRTKPYFISFDQEHCNTKIAKMIILHDYPLHIVEHQGFVNFVRTLQPQFNPLSFNAVRGDCVAMYLREKQNLLKLINGIPGRVNLTLDIWTSNDSSAYVFLQGHFIDGDWKLHHPILNVFKVPFPDSDGSLNQTIENCVNDWNLKGRLFTILFDNFFSNGTRMEKWRELLSLKNPVILTGQLLTQNCYARVLSRLVSDALSAMRETIAKVRQSVMYVKASQSHEEMFLDLRQQLQVPSKMELLIDEQNKWDTVYHMLVAASELKEVFTCFDAYDPEYRTILTMDDWKQVQTLCAYLKCLYDATNILTIQPYPTANLFFSAISKLKMELTQAALSQDPFCRSLVNPLQEKFDQYWNENCFLLAIAAAMDPRYKLKLVESTFTKIFGENTEPWMRTIEDALHELFLEYSIIQFLPLTETTYDGGNEAMIKTEQFQEGALDESIFDAVDGLSDIEFYISDFIGNNKQYNLELNEYLEEPLEPSVQEFDILTWWRTDGLKYPTLSRMASDILSMPVSTLSADSAFHLDIRKMDNYRSSLDSPTLEALICTKDWFQCQSLLMDASDEFARIG